MKIPDDVDWFSDEVSEIAVDGWCNDMLNLLLGIESSLWIAVLVDNGRLV